ncbi:homing endonuclease associated repeat-containing protein [Haladaptatus sp. GCM10025707]|uniref:homing endonuclease associated repeat-containing protein n=1 Tax=unclassified Haladaptatus TaxID=2622732 RepID=UPI0023E8E71F|nr:hypothetical protein [Haladaptatus sp. QDMS2]
MGRERVDPGSETDLDRLRQRAERHAATATASLSRGEFATARDEFTAALRHYRRAKRLAERAEGTAAGEFDARIAALSQRHETLETACATEMGAYVEAGRKHVARADERRTEGAPLAAGEELKRAKHWFLDARAVVEDGHLADALATLVGQLDHERAVLALDAMRRRLRHGIENAATLVEAADHQFSRSNYREALRTYREAETTLDRVRMGIEDAEEPTAVTRAATCVACQSPGSKALAKTGFEDIVLCAGCLADHQSQLDLIRADLTPMERHVTAMRTRLTSNEHGVHVESAFDRSITVGATDWQVEEPKLLAALTGLADRLGRVPAEADVTARGTFALYQYHRTFGSFENALVAAGMKIDAGEK